MDPMDEVDELAKRQYSLIGHRQAHASGLSAAAIRHLHARGDWQKVRHGVSAMRGAPRSWEQAVLAAILAARDNAWASHATVLRLWAFDNCRDADIEITTLREQRLRIRGVRAHRSQTLEERDLTIVRQVPALTIARTVADLSGRLDVEHLGRIVDEGLRRRITSLRAIDRVVRRLHHIAPGRSPAKLARVLALRIPGYEPGDSNLESRVYEALVASGLPTPARQYKLVAGSRTYYLDLAYPVQRIAIEVDGFDFHRGRESFDNDRRRQNDLVRAGWTVLRFTSRSTIDEIVATVTEILLGQKPLP
jgi:REase_MTES_1575/Transcriptional regulator, AbiEi antitoxin